MLQIKNLPEKLFKIHFSKVEKFEGSEEPILAWGVPLSTCQQAEKEIACYGDKAVCKHCYARAGRFIFKGSQDSLEKNLQQFQDNPELWAVSMAISLRQEDCREFRWFHCGDCSPQLAEKILQVVRVTPWIKHWLPIHDTATYSWLLSQEIPKNCNIRVSGSLVNELPEILGQNPGITYSMVVNSKAMMELSGVYVCKAYLNHGQCGSCRACWNRCVKIVAYPQKMGGYLMVKDFSESLKGAI